MAGTSFSSSRSNFQLYKNVSFSYEFTGVIPANSAVTAYSVDIGIADPNRISVIALGRETNTSLSGSDVRLSRLPILTQINYSGGFVALFTSYELQGTTLIFKLYNASLSTSYTPISPFTTIYVEAFIFYV